MQKTHTSGSRNAPSHIYVQTAHFVIDKHYVYTVYYMCCIFAQAAVAQSVARRLGKAEVTGSSPASSFEHQYRISLILKGFCIFILSGYGKRGQRGKICKRLYPFTDFSIIFSILFLILCNALSTDLELLSNNFAIV